MRTGTVGILAFLAGTSLSGQDSRIVPMRRFGSIEASVDQNEILIRRGATKWRIDLSKLVRTIDCAEPFGAEGQLCPKSPMALCPKCGRGWPDIVAWDEARQQLYFAITTSSSWDKPFQILRYHLPTRGSERIVNTWTASFADGIVSRDARYLTYVKIHHSPPAAGCVATWGIETVDLWTRRVANVELKMPKPEAIWFVDKLEWIPPAKLAVGLLEHDKDCNPVANGKPHRSVVDVRALRFTDTLPR